VSKMQATVVPMIRDFIRAGYKDGRNCETKEAIWLA